MLPETAGDNAALVRGGRQVDTAVVKGYLGTYTVAVKGMVVERLQEPPSFSLHTASCQLCMCLGSANYAYFIVSLRGQ